MRRFLTTMLTASIMISHAAMAQDAPQGFGPPGGFQGPGGPGFGPPPGRADSAVALLGMPEVQDELKLSDDQKKSIDEISQNMRQSIREIFEARAPAPGDVPPADGGNRFEQINSQIKGLTAKAEEKAKAVLNEDQNKRYSQLRLQRESSAALVRDEISKQLKLSEKQADEIRALTADAICGGNPNTLRQSA